MAPVDDQDGFPIDRNRVATYFFWSQVLAIGVVGLMLFGIGLVLAPLYAVTIGAWLPRDQSRALRYWLEGSTLRVDQGVYFLQQKAIPLERITDFALVQGPLMRHFGIWALRIQTAGMGHPTPEAVLYGLSSPFAVRDALLAAKNRTVAAST
jgi:putative membrane protein